MDVQGRGAGEYIGVQGSRGSTVEAQESRVGTVDVQESIMGVQGRTVEYSGSAHFKSPAFSSLSPTLHRGL